MSGCGGNLLGVCEHVMTENAWRWVVEEHKYACKWISSLSKDTKLVASELVLFESGPVDRDGNLARTIALLVHARERNPQLQ